MEAKILDEEPCGCVKGRMKAHLTEHKQELLLVNDEINAMGKELIKKSEKKWKIEQRIRKLEQKIQEA